MAVIIVDPDNIIEGDDVTTNTTTRRITINPGTGTNIPAAADGIAIQALYSWYKEEWKDVVGRSRYPFLFDAITPEQMEMRKNWQHASTTSEKAVRTGGWRYIDTDNGNKIVKEFMGAVSLGQFEDATADTGYYVLGNDPTDTGAAVDFDFPGPVNEPILVYENLGNPDTCNFATSNTITRGTGSFITDGYAVGGQVTVIGSTGGLNDGTFILTGVTATTLTVTGTPFTTGADTNAELAVNNRNAVALFLRVRDADPNGKTYAKSTLTDIGVSEVDNKVFRFPLANATDLNIDATDAQAVTSPWNQISIKYFSSAFSIDVDGATNRLFGIVVDVGTWSGVGGSSNNTNTFTDSNGEIPATTYDGGTLVITSGTNEGLSYTITSASGTTVTVSDGPIPTDAGPVSYYLQRATPIVATRQQIYERIQYQLRQASDINVAGGGGVVTGRTADPLAVFVGPDLIFGRSIPSNPEGGGSGVTVIGFDANDTNNLFFTDNSGSEYNYPFVAAGNILVNQNAVDDTGPAEYVMYFQYTHRLTNTGFGLSAPTGNVATLDSSTTDLTQLTTGDFILLQGFTNEENNGLYEVTGAPAGTGPWTAQVTKRFDTTTSPVAETAGATVSLDRNPIDSDDAIIVNNNSGTPITGTIGSTTIPFDFDYDNNNQGGRTPGTVANVIVRVLGTDVAVNAEATGQISRATGLSISVSNPLERNYLNPL